MALYLIIGAVVILALYLISTYNFFATAKTRVDASIQEIGNQLKRQADLIPNLESSVKGYLKHEKGILEMLSEARKLTAKGQDASKKISELLPKLQIVVESNPELKGSEVVGNLMDELRDTADKVMYARRLMIDLTADYNVKRVTFPSSIIANMFGFNALKGMGMKDSRDALEVSASETKTPKVDL